MNESQLETRDVAHLSLVVPPHAAVPSAAETLHAPAPKLPARNIGGELANLRASCKHYLDQVESVRDYYVEVANEIAALLSEVGLQDMILPRNYQVKCHQYRAYLLKVSDDGTARFVASGQDDLFTRMGVGPRCSFSTADLAEFVNDLNQGLIAELTTYVTANRTIPASISTAAFTASQVHAAVEGEAVGGASGERASQLRNLGRRARRTGTA